MQITHHEHLVKKEEEATVYVKELDLLVTVKLLDDTPAVLLLGTLCDDHGLVRNHISLRWQTHTSTENYVPIVVLVLSTSSSSSTTHTSPASLPQAPVVSALRQATTRSESTSGQARGDLSLEPTETENTQKMRTRTWHMETRCMICQDGYQN